MRWPRVNFSVLAATIRRRRQGLAFAYVAVDPIGFVRGGDLFIPGADLVGGRTNLFAIRWPSRAKRLTPTRFRSLAFGQKEERA